MDEGTVLLAIVLNVAVIVGGVLVILMAMYQRTRSMEMRHRERMAMIERGLAPNPEKDPEGFDQWNQPRRPVSRSTSIGVVWIALGFGLMLIIGVAGGSAGPAVGIGGAIVVLGLAFIVNGELHRRSHPAPPPPSSGPPSFGRPAPPTPPN